MAEKAPQTFANHTRFDPLFHFFVAGVRLGDCHVPGSHFFAHITEGDFRDHFHAFMLVLLAIALVGGRGQDSACMPAESAGPDHSPGRAFAAGTPCSEPLRARIPELTEDQLVALRFASDAEVPGTGGRALTEKLSRAEIKKSIQTWRPDYCRV